MRWLLVVALCASPALADTRVMRLATVVPDGTAWAREGRAFARDVDQLTHGRVQIKWLLGGIAGDETEVRQRIGRGQIDGGALSMECYHLSPTLRVMRMLGLFQNRQEAAYVIGRLKPQVDSEMSQQGFANLMEAGVGSDLVFSRAPVHSFADLKRQRHWVWALDDTLKAQLDMLGFQTVALPITQASRAYDEGRTDGFISSPTAALAFQWSTQATHLTPLRLAFVEGCLVVANRAFDALEPDDQQALRTAAAKLQARFEDLGRAQDAALLGGLFAKQGVQSTPITESMTAELFAAAASVRDRLAPKLLPPGTLERVQAMLADWRGEHGNQPAR